VKIATIADDGEIICQHFNRATYYLVATVENDDIMDCELCDKLGHA
jgi:predicted Fe-Mo cluster-binding NifX family protein